MRISDLDSYVKSLSNEGLTKIEVKSSFNPDGGEDFYIDETKETFVYATEDEADAKVDEVRQNSGFKSAEKKFKQGKVNKAGEVVKPDTYTVVVKLLH